MISICFGMPKFGNEPTNISYVNSTFYVIYYTSGING